MVFGGLSESTASQRHQDEEDVLHPLPFTRIVCAWVLQQSLLFRSLKELFSAQLKTSLPAWDRTTKRQSTQASCATALPSLLMQTGLQAFSGDFHRQASHSTHSEIQISGEESKSTLKAKVGTFSPGMHTYLSDGRAD